MAQRPPHVTPPAHLSPNPPLPEPDAVVPDGEPDPLGIDPTRYGDWERTGVAVDF